MCSIIALPALAATVACIPRVASRWSRLYAASSSVGLFGHEHLSTPADWAKVTTQAIQGSAFQSSACKFHVLDALAIVFKPCTACRCNALMQDVQTCSPGRGALHLLDEISDRLCHATDTAAFCSATHADPEWRAAAWQSNQKLQSYMAELNTSPVLWSALSRSMERVHQQPPEQRDQEGWTEEEIKVGDSLMHEFRQAGMALDERVQEQYRQLSSKEHTLSTALMAFEVLQLAAPVMFCCISEVLQQQYR